MDSGSESKKVIDLAKYRQLSDGLSSYVEKSYDFSRDGEQSGGSGEWDQEVKAFLDAQTLKSLFYSEDWVFIVTDLVATKISSQMLYVMKQEMVNGKYIVSTDESHPLNSLIQNPNQWQDYHSWMYNQIVELILLGNSITWFAKSKNHLTTLPGELITIDFEASGKINQYYLATARETLLGSVDKKNLVAFSPDEMLHIRRPNPGSLVWGLSPFVPGRKSILFNRYSSDYLNAFYQKQATPGMAITLQKATNEDTALRMLRSFELAYTGRKNMRRTMVLPAGVDIKPLSHTLADQKLVEMIDKNRETILSILKVPKHELSLQTSGSLGSEEYRTALKNFWEATLIPTMKLVEGAYNKFFKEELGENYFFKFDLSDVKILKEDEKEKAQTAALLLNAGWSVNEVRTEIYEKEASEAEDANKPFNLISKAPQQGFAMPPPTNNSLGVDKNNKAALLKYLAKHDGWLDRTQKQLDEELSGKTDDMVDFVLDTFAQMAEKAIGALLGKKAVKADVPSKPVLRRRIDRAISDLEEQYSEGLVKRLKSSVEVGYDQQLDLVFDQRNKTEIQALREKDEKDRRLSLQSRGLDSFAYISKTTTEEIMQEVEAGVAKQETLTDIAKRIANLFTDPVEMMGRAKTIARTETLTAVSIGQNAAVQNAKTVIPGLKKAWLSAGDDRVRDSHAFLDDGKAIDVDAKFANGLSYPRDPSASNPAEVINCRCTLIMIPPGENL